MQTPFHMIWSVFYLKYAHSKIVTIQSLKLFGRLNSIIFPVSYIFFFFYRLYIFKEELPLSRVRFVYFCSFSIQIVFKFTLLLLCFPSLKKSLWKLPWSQEKKSLKIALYVRPFKPPLSDLKMKWWYIQLQSGRTPTYPRHRRDTRQHLPRGIAVKTTSSKSSWTPSCFSPRPS